MAKKEPNSALEFIREHIVSKKLSPNAFYLLASMEEGIAPLFVNPHVDLPVLIEEGYAIKVGEVYRTTDKGRQLIDQIDQAIGKKVKKLPAKLQYENLEENIKKYLDIFPAIQGGSGSYLRCTPKNLEPAFKWFFENYDYDWELILRATSRYVHEHSQKEYKYIRTAKYFIRKQENDKSFNSDLANYCARILTGVPEVVTPIFKDKVV